MTRARDFADVISGNFDLPAGALDNTPSVNDSLVINGACQVAQRGNVSLAASSTKYTAVDRFELQQQLLDQGAVTTSQSTDSPDDFAHSLKVDVTTAESNVSTTEFSRINYFIEGQDLQQLNYGTSSAKSLTISFYVKSNQTGNFAFQVVNNDFGRARSAPYTINAANTWEQKTLTIPGDTNTGDPISNDADQGLRFSWYLTAGSSLTSSDNTSAWAAPTNSNTAYNHTANIYSSTSNEFFITGVKIEVGTSATAFVHEPFETVLKKCQRYFQRVEGTIFPCRQVNSTTGAAVTSCTIHLPIFNGVMRAEPTLTGANITLRSESGGTTATVTSLVSSAHEQSLVTANFGSADVTNITQLRSDYIEIDAEI
jgi:hypothetical protein